MPPRKKPVEGKPAEMKLQVVTTKRRGGRTRTTPPDGNSHIAYTEATPLKKAKKESDEDIAMNLQEMESRGQGHLSETPLIINGHTVAMPFQCVCCDDTFLTVEAAKRHLGSAPHADSVRSFIETHDQRITAEERKALIETCTYSTQVQSPLQSIARLKALAKPNLNPKKASKTEMEKLSEPGAQSASTTASDAARETVELGVPKKLSRDEVRMKLQASIGNDSSAMSHSDSDAHQRVFLLTLEALATYADDIKRVPLPAWCVPCRADLKNHHAMSAHLSGRPHKQKLQAAINEEYESEPDSKGQDRRTFSPPNNQRAPMTIYFDCPRTGCKNRISGADGSSARCNKCKGEFNVPRPVPNSAGKRF